MISLLFTFLFACLTPMVAGAIALVRSFGAPSGKGAAAAGGALLLLSGLVTTGWHVYTRFVLSPDPFFDPGLMLAPPGVVEAVFLGVGALRTGGLVLLLVAVLSARKFKDGPQGPPAPAGHPYGTAPGAPAGGPR